MDSLSSPPWNQFRPRTRHPAQRTLPELYSALLDVAKPILRARNASLVQEELINEAYFELLREDDRRRRQLRSFLGDKPTVLFKACEILIGRWRRTKR